jgi:hypothetical protein
MFIQIKINMEYEEMVERVVSKLEDSGYDSVEEWAEVILKSIGIEKPKE